MSKNLEEHLTYLMQESEEIIEYIKPRPAFKAQAPRKAQVLTSYTALSYASSVKALLRALADLRKKGVQLVAPDINTIIINDLDQHIDRRFDELKQWFQQAMQHTPPNTTREGSPTSNTHPPLWSAIASSKGSGDVSLRARTTTTANTTTTIPPQDPMKSKQVHIRDCDEKIVNIREQPNYEKELIRTARILLSGDIYAYAQDRTTCDRLLHNRAEWERDLGESARVMVPTYGVVVSSMPIQRIDMARQEQIITGFKEMNPEIEEARIERVRWLGRPALDKQVSVVIMEFNDPRDANIILSQGGILWEGSRKKVQRFDKNCMAVQCFYCHKYDHTMAAYKKSPVCGYCSSPDHPTREHPDKKDTSKYQCSLCKGRYTAWDRNCEHKKKVLAKIDETKKDILLYSLFYVPDITPGVSEVSEHRVRQNTVIIVEDEPIQAIILTNQSIRDPVPFISKLIGESTGMANKKKPNRRVKPLLAVEEETERQKKEIEEYLEGMAQKKKKGKAVQKNQLQGRPDIRAEKEIKEALTKDTILEDDEGSGIASAAGVQLSKTSAPAITESNPGTDRTE
ncbi:hypothetical protein F5884DRAFT_758626 [Xylogone sp. PMI_703]|nr:hypothetical protein F5884DRAFT_758626 [Xylogone sp. PMI_703]